MSEVWSDKHGAYDCCKPKLYRNIVSTGNIDHHTGSCRTREQVLDSVNFTIQSFTKVDEEDRTPYLFVNCLVEFGCEALLPHYFLPALQHKRDTYRLVCIGWEGREILYKNYVDEFWGLKPEYNFLRNYTRAFGGASKNIRNIENVLSKQNFVYKSGHVGNYFLKNECPKCLKIMHGSHIEKCSQCGNKNIKKSILGGLQESKKKYFEYYLNLDEYKHWAKHLINNKTIGIFARKRPAYGRNLSEEFYIKLIDGIKKEGYDVIWLGERESTMKCPVKDIFDFTTSQYADDLGRCLSLVSRCSATFQAWTASTRISQLTNVPFCLVESPEQLYGRGQEGRRLYLLTKDFDKKKILLSDYYEIKNQQENFAEYCLDNFFDFLHNKNSNDVVGYVSNYENVIKQMKENPLW